MNNGNVTLDFQIDSTCQFPSEYCLVSSGKEFNYFGTTVNKIYVTQFGTIYLTSDIFTDSYFPTCSASNCISVFESYFYIDGSTYENGNRLYYRYENSANKQYEKNQIDDLLQRNFNASTNAYNAHLASSFRTEWFVCLTFDRVKYFNNFDDTVSAQVIIAFDGNDNVVVILKYVKIDGLPSSISVFFNSNELKLDIFRKNDDLEFPQSVLENTNGNGNEKGLYILQVNNNNLMYLNEKPPLVEFFQGHICFNETCKFTNVYYDYFGYRKEAIEISTIHGLLSLNSKANESFHKSFTNCNDIEKNNLISLSCGTYRSTREHNGFYEGNRVYYQRLDSNRANVINEKLATLLNDFGFCNSYSECFNSFRYDDIYVITYDRMIEMSTNKTLTAQVILIPNSKNLYVSRQNTYVIIDLSYMKNDLTAIEQTKFGGIYDYKTTDILVRDYIFPMNFHNSTNVKDTQKHVKYEGVYAINSFLELDYSNECPVYSPSKIYSDLSQVFSFTETGDYGFDSVDVIDIEGIPKLDVKFYVSKDGYLIVANKTININERTCNSLLQDEPEVDITYVIPFCSPELNAIPRSNKYGRIMYTSSCSSNLQIEFKIPLNNFLGSPWSVPQKLFLGKVIFENIRETSHTEEDFGLTYSITIVYTQETTVVDYSEELLEVYDLKFETYEFYAIIRYNLFDYEVPMGDVSKHGRVIYSMGDGRNFSISPGSKNMGYVEGTNCNIPGTFVTHLFHWDNLRVKDYISDEYLSSLKAEEAFWDAMMIVFIVGVSAGPVLFGVVFMILVFVIYVGIYGCIFLGKWLNNLKVKLREKKRERNRRERELEEARLEEEREEEERRKENETPGNPDSDFKSWNKKEKKKKGEVEISNESFRDILAKMEDKTKVESDEGQAKVDPDCDPEEGY